VRRGDHGQRPPAALLPGAALLTDLFRQQLFLTRTPPDKEIITGIVDDVFLPLVRS
jgi:hypothetical protein